MGGLGELAAAGAVRPGRGGGGSPELEKMAASELAEAGEDDGGGGRGRGPPPRALGFAEHPRRGEGVASRGTLVLSCFFSFFGNQNSFFLKLECAAGNWISCTRTL